ncbi:PPE family protein [[Mycobacterium] kokjensenii]|uniref:PPE family protein n=1 Tax=[Mycobacterium] kokjensenii TaxID=3064287 RepID=A0ABM9LJM6_9MYCO|nr:PPE family protein [Mycolicibacter sp. MU0083]CAJ1500185.1 PPE family protein [Mycolicibacter sp. MU0083]
MDYAALPPEINSGRMYAGPGTGSLLAAGAAWDQLAAELHTAASNYQSVISGLTSGAWTGVASTRMAAAAGPYITWLSATGTQAEQAGAQAKAAAAAHASAYAMTVPPPAIAANRAQLATLVATNFFGQNTPAIAATEALYAEMWAQDATAMYAYAAAAETASQMTPFAPPPQTANPAGAVAQSAAATQGAGQAATSQVLQGLSNALVGSAAAGDSALPAIFSELSTLGAAPVSTFMSTAIIAAFIPEYLIAAADLPSPFGLSEAAPASIAAGVGLGLAPVMAAPASAGLASATTAGVGTAQSVSGLSVPKAWATAAPEMRLAAAEFAAANVVASESAAGGMLSGMPLFGGAPLMAMGGRGANGQYRENKSVEDAKRKAVRGRRSTMW